MFDTVVASIDGYIDPLWFPNHSVTDGVHRFWRNPDKGEYAPRVTYWIGAERPNGRIRIEFSIPKLLHLDLTNPSAEQVRTALQRVDAFLRVLNPSLPSILTWQAQRIDYAWNFEPSEDVAQYITMLQGLWLGRMSRHPHPDAEGVVWKSRQANHRWVKFYNKTKEARGNGTPVLRFEVSNYRRSLSYMCDKWLGCDRTVGDLLHPGRALYVMARVWSKLGLFSASYRVGDGLLIRLKQLFGNAAPGALYALMCIKQYGSDTHKVYHLLSDNTYYRWQRDLTKHDLLVSSDVSLPSLCLPTTQVIQELMRSNPHNLSNIITATERGFNKISPKNRWEWWTEVLQVAKKSPEIGRFTASLEVSLEGFIEQTEYMAGVYRVGRQPETQTAATGAAD